MNSSDSPFRRGQRSLPEEVAFRPVGEDEGDATQMKERLLGRVLQDEGVLDMGLMSFSLLDKVLRIWILLQELSQGRSWEDKTEKSNRGDWWGRQRPDHEEPCRPYWVIYPKGFGKPEHSWMFYVCVLPGDKKCQREMVMRTWSHKEEMWAQISTMHYRHRRTPDCRISFLERTSVMAPGPPPPTLRNTQWSRRRWKELYISEKLSIATCFGTAMSPLS